MLQYPATASKVLGKTLSDKGSVKDLFALLGEARLNNDTSVERHLLQAVEESCLSMLSKEEVSQIVKHQHPKLALQKILTMKELNLSIICSSHKDGVYTIEAQAGDIHTSGVHECVAEAELIAVREMLKHFPEELETMPVGELLSVFEEEVNLGLVLNQQRVVTLVKTDSEPFGFHIRGGEKKLVKNRRYMKKYETTPVFISKIVEDSAADRCGHFQVGDVLLAVNDHRLIDLPHDQVVANLKKFQDHEEVEFTLKFDKNVIVEDEVILKHKLDEKKRLDKELKLETHRNFHIAKASKKPEKYVKHIGKGK